MKNTENLESKISKINKSVVNLQNCCLLCKKEIESLKEDKESLIMQVTAIRNIISYMNHSAFLKIPEAMNCGMNQMMNGMGIQMTGMMSSFSISEKTHLHNNICAFKRKYKEVIEANDDSSIKLQKIHEILKAFFESISDMLILKDSILI